MCSEKKLMVNIYITANNCDVTGPIRNSKLLLRTNGTDNCAASRSDWVRAIKYKIYNYIS